MIVGREENTIPLIRNMKDDRYIFYTGKKVSSSKFDLEAMLKDKPTYKVLLLVDQLDSMELLSKRIGETMERFAIFSGLPGLTAKNLYIKNDKGINPAPLDGIVSDYIKSGDVIIFDLEYNEIWVEVDMTLFCVGKEYKILFSLKVNLNEKLLNFKQNLISISVELWNNFIKEDNNDIEIYYLLKKFEFDGIRKLEIINELEKTYNYVKEKYNFESKIKCNAEFININEHIQKFCSKKIKESKDSFLESHFNNYSINKSLHLRKISQNYNEISYNLIVGQISDTLQKLVSKCKNILEYVMWKTEENLEEELKQEPNLYSTEFSRCNSMTEDYDSKFYPRIPTLFSLGKMSTDFHLSDKMFTSASPLKIKYNNRGDELVKIHKPPKFTNCFNDMKFTQLSEILKNFSLHDFINENAEITFNFFKNNNEIKIINVKDLNSGDKSRNSSKIETHCNTPDPMHEIRRISAKKTTCDTIKKKKQYLILVIILFLFFYYVVL